VSRKPYGITLVGTGVCEVPDCDCANEHDPSEAFAYTCGLHEHGVAELHLSAHPESGSEMPVMAGYNLPVLLRRIADGYLIGAYRPGDGVVVHGWPGGFAVELLLEAELADRDEVECYLTHPHADVRRLTWCAHHETDPTSDDRRPEGARP
jgi:hypothetical protein